MTIEHLIIIFLVFALRNIHIQCKENENDAKFWREQAEHDFRRYMDLINKKFEDE